MVRTEIDGGSVLQWMFQVSQFGATAAGGLDRQVLSEPEISARLWLAQLAHQLDLDVFTDPIGNIFLRAEGSDPSLPPVLAGSHLDSQPRGGRYDGTYGVVAALAAVNAIKRSNGVQRRSLEVVAWTNEEGSRFRPGAMGSRAFVNPLVLPQYLQAKDQNGISVGEDISSWFEASKDLVKPRALGFPAAAYVEAHIEQGPVLEKRGIPIGAVTGIQGIRRYMVEIDGVAGHAGTTPNSARSDALMQAVDLICHLKQALNDSQDQLRFTIGQMHVAPGGVSVIPDNVTFTIDLRHPNESKLEAAASAIAKACVETEGPCNIRIHESSRSVTQQFDDRIISLIERAAESLGHEHYRMPSGAGHDAGPMNTVCPSGMIFIPCRAGVSHHESEFAEPDHMIAGANVLARVLLELAT